MPEDFHDLLDHNRRFARSFDQGGLPARPRQQLAVLTCMDCRIDEHLAFGIGPGDAHVLRNAGARVTDDVIRSLIKSTHQLGAERIAVIHHTDCGAAKIQRDQLRSTVREATGHDPDDLDFHLIADPDQALLDDLERLCRSPYLLPGTPIGGFVYDVRTGVLTPRARGTVGGGAPEPIASSPDGAHS